MKKILSMTMALCMVFVLCACGAAPADEDAGLGINVMVLNGTTGFGMAKLMTDAQAGDGAFDYRFSVETDASNITAALISGDCDIAALPTNAAASLYNKTAGGIQCIALNTLGVLYLVENTADECIRSLADLEGKTVYAPAQNPSFIFGAICKKAGVNVTIDNRFAQPVDLRTALAAGEVSLAVLPEPMVTIAESANEALSAALDLTKEWDALFAEGSLVQGCAVVRTEFAEAHPNAVSAFLEEYGASVRFVTENPGEASEMIAAAGVFAQAAVAEKAIPSCNLCFLTGEEMKDALSVFLSVMYETAPASVGGALPADSFYYLP